MKIIVAPDKFKGSLTGVEFCNAVEEGVKRVLPQANVIKVPLADGGDGTIEILDYHLKGETVKAVVNNPLFKKIQATYLYIKTSKTAFIEMAEASGMKLLSLEEQNCMNTSTFGTGELILDAIKKGAKTVVLGIGGSATNDCGIGMATALGYQFLDKRGNEIEPIGKNLLKIKSIDISKVNKSIKNIEFKVACDVTNPLYGKNGAAYIYAPQKGASNTEVKLLDIGLRNIAQIVLKQFKVDVQNVKGAGAAGGMGAGTKVFLGATLISGVELVKQMIGFNEKLKNTDWIITGEGKLDTQTLSGKTISGVLNSAKQQNIPVVAFCGSINLPKKELKKMGILYANSVIAIAKNLDDAIKNSNNYILKIAEEFTKKVINK